MEKQVLLLWGSKKEEVLRWAEDSSWINQERYEDDDAYLACVEDILENTCVSIHGSFYAAWGYYL